MRKITSLVAGLLILSVLSGCYTLKVEAPKGTQIALSSDMPEDSVKVTKRVWYVLWGLIPISNNSTAKMIEESCFTEVKCRTYSSFVDILITGVLNVLPTTIYVNTLEVEGK